MQCVILSQLSRELPVYSDSNYCYDLLLKEEHVDLRTVRSTGMTAWRYGEHYQNNQRHLPGDSGLHSYGCENLNPSSVQKIAAGLRQHSHNWFRTPSGYMT
jgi:hypothetical protein